jgi:hypothetical protein
LCKMEAAKQKAKELGVRLTKDVGSKRVTKTLAELRKDLKAAKPKAEKKSQRGGATDWEHFVAVCEATLESARQNIIGAPSVNVAGSALTLKYSVALGVLRGPDRVYSVHIVAHTRSSGGVSWDVGVKKKQDGNRTDAADLQNIEMIKNVWTDVFAGSDGVKRADILDSFEAAMTLFSVSSPANSGSSMNNY